MTIEAKTPLRTKRIVIALVLSVAASSLLLGAALYTKAKQDDALRSGLVENCKRNGNPLRATVRGILEDEIEQSEQADLSKFFPQISPTELDELIEGQNEAREERIAQLHSIDCEAQYK